MATRKIIKIDEEKCIGCGKCANACHNGALKIVDGKAKLVGEINCDGFGVCLGSCPVDALTIEEREAEEYGGKSEAPGATPKAHTCPGTAARSFSGGCPGTASRSFAGQDAVKGGASALTHWPIQLKLIMPTNPAYQNADVLLAADCTAFSLGTFHPELLQGKGLIIACPKLDDRSGYVEKIRQLLTEAKPKSLTIARMEVPCCMGLTGLVEEARTGIESDTVIREVIVGIEGEIQSERDL